MTEHKNTILAIVLSLVVVVGWQFFVGNPQMEKQRQEALLKQQEQAHPQPGASQPGRCAAALPRRHKPARSARRPCRADRLPRCGAVGHARAGSGGHCIATRDDLDPDA